MLLCNKASTSCNKAHDTHEEARLTKTHVSAGAREAFPSATGVPCERIACVYRKTPDDVLGEDNRWDSSALLIDRLQNVLDSSGQPIHLETMLHGTIALFSHFAH